MTQEGEDTWMANVHVINLRHLETDVAHHCLECPCTTDNDFRLHSSLNDGLPWDACNADLVHEKNPTCFKETYAGGLRCCANEAYCLEEGLNDQDPESTYYLRYTISYAPVVPENKPVYVAGCCDASGNLTHHGAIEYDIPICNETIHPGCVHTLSTVQRLNGASSAVFGAFAMDNPTPDLDPSREVEMVFAVGHQHRGGLGISIYDAITDDLICGSVPSYGKGEEAGNEHAYIVAMSTCTFDPPMRVKANTLLRITALYDNTKAHTGVMSLFYVALAEIPKAVSENVVLPTKAATSEVISITSPLVTTPTNTITPESTSRGNWWFSSLLTVGALCTLVGVMHTVRKRRERRVYRPLVSQ